MTYTRDGGVVPNHVKSRAYSGTSDRNQGFGVVRGYIKKVIHVDDKENITGYLEYVVIIDGHDHFGVLDATQLGGIFNNHVKVRKGQTPELDVRSMNPSSTEDKKNGDLVWCIFIRGSVEKPLIIGAGEHPRISENSDYKSPTKSLGEFERYEFNGVEFMIDKDGNFTVTQLGLKNQKTGKAAPPQTGYIKVDKTGNFEIKTTLGTIAKIIDSPSEIEISSASGDKINVSATNGIQAEVATGVKLSMKDGKYGVEAPSDITVVSSAGSVTVEGVGGAKMKLGTAKVGLGGPGGEIVDLLEQVLSQLDTLTTQMQAETHPTAVGPSGPPVNAAAYGLVQTALGLIKGKVTAIKGGI